MGYKRSSYQNFPPRPRELPWERDDEDDPEEEGEDTEELTICRRVVLR